MTSTTSKARPLPPDPRAIAEMIPVRRAEIAARTLPRCPVKGHGLMVARDLGRQTYEVMWCGVWYDCQDPRCNNSASIPSRELAAYHGEPYNVDGEHFETWNGRAWQPVSKAEVDAYWAEREAGRERQQAEAGRAAARRQRSRRRTGARS
jgi:hypothetical protein